MICSECKIPLIVKDSAKDKDAIYRERECPICGELCFTVERSEAGAYTKLRYLRNHAVNKSKERRKNETN